MSGLCYTMLNGGAGVAGEVSVGFSNSYNYIYRLCMFFHLSIAAVTLTQTHPAAPYVCRTGNITLRCQYDAADLVSWSVDDMSNVDPSTIPGHAISDSTTTYQELVVDSYTNLRERYQCTVVVGSSVSNSNNFMPAQPEGKQ